MTALEFLSSGDPGVSILRWHHRYVLQVHRSSGKLFCVYISICLTSPRILTVWLRREFFHFTMCAIWLGKSVCLTAPMSRTFHCIAKHCPAFLPRTIICSDAFFLRLLSCLSRPEATLSPRSRGTEMDVLSQREAVLSWTTAFGGYSAWASKVCRKLMVVNTPVRLQMMVEFVKWLWNWQWKVRGCSYSCCNDCGGWLNEQAVLDWFRSQLYTRTRWCKIHCLHSAVEDVLQGSACL